jgi:hypothetical protein
MLNRRQPAVRFVFLPIIASFLLGATSIWAGSPGENSPALQIEIPEAKITATNEPFLNLESTGVQLVLIHILSPEADGLDYGQIFPKVNGAAASRITETRAGINGKVLRMSLNLRPGFELLPGNNTIELHASNNGHAIDGTFNLHAPAGPCVGGGRAKILELTSLGDLLHAGVIMDRLVQLVVACGVNFQPSALTDQKLQDLGADARLLAAIHNPTAPEFRNYQSKAVTLDQVVDLLQSHLPEASIIANVEDNGVNFPVNPGVEEKLRAAGASQKLIQSINYVAGTKVAAGDEQALSVSQLLHLLQGGEMSKDRIFTLVQQRGVNFRLDRATEDRLRQAGANEKLMRALRDASDHFSTTH